MTVRAGLEPLVVRLREMTEAGDEDYAIAGVTYWTGEQLQSVLDGHRTDIIRDYLEPRYEYNGGTLEYHDYLTPHRNLEESASGAPAWEVEDAAGNTIGTALYSVNYEAGVIRFANDTEGSALYLMARSYNLNRAAAELWEKKAAHAAKGYAFTADGATFHREQVYEHCLKMAEHYRGKSGMKVSRLFRSDV